jgi:hypothetical protein
MPIRNETIGFICLGAMGRGTITSPLEVLLAPRSENLHR